LTDSSSTEIPASLIDQFTEQQDLADGTIHDRQLDIGWVRAANSVANTNLI
jgi:hypothetical protein